MTNTQNLSSNHQPPKGKVFLIRADASFEIGIGHVMRCIALGQMLIDEGHQVIFLTQTDNQMIKERILKEGFGLNTFCENDILKDAGYTANTGKDVKADWVVTDGYKFTTEYQKIIKNAGFKLMCIDDICGCHYVSDIVLNQNLNAERNYQYSKEKYTKLFLGKEYVLLRREFQKFKSKPSELNKEAKNVLITFGGSDSDNYTEKVICHLNLKKNQELYIKAILGPNNVQQKSIEESIRNQQISNAEIIYNPVDLISLLLWSDLVISSSGTIVWEVLKLNKPMLLIPIAINQIINSKELKNKYTPYIHSIVSLENGKEVLNFIDNYKNLKSPLDYNYQSTKFINNIFN